MGRTRRAIAIVAFTLVSCSNQTIPASTPTTDAAILRLYTTTATVRLANELTYSYSQIRPSVSFDIIESNYQAVLDHVLAEQSAYFLTNHLPAPDETALWAAPIGQDGIAIIAHPDNTVHGLTMSQLRDIYQGRITNWSDVGGNDQPIRVFTREEGSGTRVEFEQLVMGDRQTTRSAMIAPSGKAMMLSVMRESNGIGYVSMSYLDSSVQALALDDTALTSDTVYDNTYPLRSTLFIAGMQEPQDAEYRAFIGWAQSPVGQEIVQRFHAPMLKPEPLTETAS